MSWGLLVIAIALFVQLILLDFTGNRIDRYARFNRKRVTVYSLVGTLIQMLVLLALIVTTSAWAATLMYGLRVLDDAMAKYGLWYAIATIAVTIATVIWFSEAYNKIIYPYRAEEKLLAEQEPDKTPAT